MATRSAEVKSYVVPSVKAQAAEVYAHWGMSLSDAVNAFLIKSIDVGGFPFELRASASPRYDRSKVIPANPKWGSSVLPAAIDDEEDGLYDHLAR